ncbi:Vacuolar protein sorting-associated protein 22-like protein 1 [Hibiscus syriacus]|uniref:Vacuolar protein sorting-associated protein 22-like protein 1 n=1 Tax=Hibiscus syriacus TaxID=106335 RepID=A0A6A3D017_HIBSY|nr:Vacuolar protein sorting-associated protein 22-like protein 1 [Hibiscus syriacus]
MCAKVGVDPLASNKGFWAELLGIGDFYYELGVQIVEICLATRPLNGGREGEPEKADHFSFVTLGSGFEVIYARKKKLVRSVPTELNKDHNAILEMAQAQGYVTVDEEGLAMMMMVIEMEVDVIGSPVNWASAGLPVLHMYLLDHHSGSVG